MYYICVCIVQSRQGEGSLYPIRWLKSRQYVSGRTGLSLFSQHYGEL